MPGASERNKRVTFQRYETAENSFGEPVANAEPVDLGKALAHVFYGRGAERRAAAAESASMAATFKVLSTTTTRSVRVSDVISFQGQWDIEGIAPIGRTDLEFTAVRRM